MHQQFIDREQELEFLESLYRSEKPELVILYGRRRIGKTRLINEFLRDKAGIYFLCVGYSEIENLRLLQAQMGDFLGDESFKKLRIADLEELFQEFFKWHAKKERIVFAIDEFPYLIALNSGVVSIFQRIWDLNLSRQNVMLVLCGSSIGMMETEVLSYRSPLYGRRTAQWRLEKLGFEYLKRFFPAYSMEDLIGAYGCLDSVPEYLLKFSPNLGFWENLRRIVSKGSFLYEEAEILLREEFREPRNYTLILRAIAEGSRKLAEIASTTGIDKGALSRYIYNLQRVGIVDAELPAAFPKKSKRSLYTLTDNYFKFYFRFVLPNKNNIEAEIDITPKIKKEYDAYLGIIFEELARELVKRGKINLGFSLEDVSAWWHRGEEIDIVALNESTKEIAFFECKWGNISKRDAERILSDLERKAALVKWHNNKRKEYYGIIAKSIKRKEELRSEGYLVYDLRDFG